MARLRFPGRPGYRFDRLGVRYGVDEGQRGLDPTTRLIANIHRGLRFFREHFGESDEEEEFSGFTLTDIKQATKKYQDSLEESQKLEEEDEAVPVAPKKSAAKKTVAALVSEGICREAPRRRMSDRVREEVKESKEKIRKLKEPASKTKTSVTKEKRPGRPARPVSVERPQSTATTLSLDQDSPKKEKKKKKDAKKVDDSEQSGRVKVAKKVLTGQAAKKKERLDKAKVLLAKAREDKKKKTEDSKTKQPKQFVLPTVSSRSSRKIKPSKRYIEEYVDYTPVTKKRPRLSESSPGIEDEGHVQPETEPVLPVVSPKSGTSRTKPVMSPPAVVTSTVDAPTTSLSPTVVPSTSTVVVPQVSTVVVPQMSTVVMPQMSAETLPLSVDIPGCDLPSVSTSGSLLSPRMGLFDQPLIVEGKRQRKPSIKLIRKITDEEYDTRTLENRRKIEERKTQENDVSEMDRSQLAVLERHAEATKRSGQNILRKAKFQLNRAALNRSKAALARQLKRKMKKEGQQGEALHQGQLSPGGFPKPQFGVSPIQLSPLRLGSFGQPLGIAALSTGSALSHKMTFLKPGTSPSPLFGGSTCVKLSSKEGSFAAADSAATSSTGRIFGTGGDDEDVEDDDISGDCAVDVGGVLSGTESPKKIKKKRPKKQSGADQTRCAICNCECTSKKSTHGGRYLGVPSCEPCSRFYSRRIVQQIRDKVAFVCDKDNKCEITLESKASCVACRYNKCLAMFPLPKIVVLKELKNQGLDDEMCERALMEFEQSQEMMKVGSSSQAPASKSPSAAKVKKKEAAKKDVSPGKKVTETGDVAKKVTEMGDAPPDASTDASEPKEASATKELSNVEQLKLREEKRALKEARRKDKVKSVAVKQAEKELKLKSVAVRRAEREEKLKTIAEKRAEKEARIKKKLELRDLRLHINKESKLKLKQAEVERYMAMTDEEKEEFRKQRREYNRQWMAHKRARVKSEKLAVEVLTDLAVGPVQFIGSPPLPVAEGELLLSPEGVVDPAELGKVTTPEGAEREEVVDTPPGRGPRIKHVCRKAAVALGTPATFPPLPRELRLSALPVTEKERILKKDELERPGSPDSDDMSMEEIIRRARDDTEVMPGKQTTPKTSLRALMPKTSNNKQPVRKNYKRKMRCKKCENCLKKPCGKCSPCLDSPAFGGKGTMKKACIFRECLNPILPMIHGARSPNSNLPMIGKVKKCKPDALKQARTDHSLGNIQSVLNRSSKLYAFAGMNPMQFQNSSLGADGSSKSSSGRSSPAVWLPDLVAGKGFGKKKQLKKGKQNGQDSRFGMEPLRPVNTVQLTATQRAHHRLKPDFPESYDIDVAWQRGFSLISAGPQCVRTVCFLCGSAGKHKMLYCSVCCEPYHTFCLDEDDRPLQENLENWCCRRCQFCHVCGKRSRLLKCDKCQDTYHPECLGPNYPTKPSPNKHIWICTKCVKCKSCGAATPGKASNAMWTHDFSLCYECGRLMDKGNYCPMCHKCYADDDWDTKMIQCSTCDAWIHAKCEGLTDEKYQLLSYLPDDVTYNCRYCSPTRPAPWELMMKQEMLRGFTQILNTIMSSKSSQHLSSIPDNLNDSLAADNAKDPTEPLVKEVAQGTPDVPTEEEQLKIDVQLTTDDLVNQVCAVFGEDIPISSIREGAVSSEESDATGICESVLNELIDSVVGCHDSGQEPVAMETNFHDEGMESQMSTVRQSSNETEMNSSEHQSCVETTDMNVLSQKSEESQIHDSQVPSIPCAHAERNITSCDHKISPDSTNALTSSNSTHHEEPLHVDTSIHSYFAHQSESTFTSPEIPDQPFLPPGTSADLINLRDFHDGVYNALMNSRSPSGTYTADELSSLTSPLSGSCQEFGLKLKTNIRNPKKIKFKTPRLDFPRDVKTVRRKLQDGLYATVEEFVDDIVRIIQFNLQEEEGVTVVKKKARNTVRGLFIKQMKAYFPWFEVETCNHWSKSTSLPDGILLDAILPPSTDHTYAQWMEREKQPTSPHPSPFKKVTSPKKRVVVPMGSLDSKGESVSDKEEIGEDTRKCVLCQDMGDQADKDCGRLLYAGQNDWVHVNCALWSAEVYEEVDGSLQHVSAASSRARLLRCDLCGKAGATVGCCSRGCNANFHFMCARKKHCVFQEDKKVYCNNHRCLIDGEPVNGNGFAVLRRMCVEYEPTKWKRWSKGLESSVINVLAGSITIESLGKLIPLSDTKTVLCPVEFCATRVFWSTVDARRRAVYTCRIVLVRPNQDCQTEAIVRDRTIIHDVSHPDYDAEIAINWLQATLPMSNPAKEKDPTVKLLSQENSQDSFAFQAEDPTSDYGMPSFGAELLSVLQLDGGNRKGDELMEHDGTDSAVADAVNADGGDASKSQLTVGFDFASLATPTKKMILGSEAVSEGRVGSGEGGGGGGKKRGGGGGGGVLYEYDDVTEERYLRRLESEFKRKSVDQTRTGNLTTEGILEMLSAPPSDREDAQDGAQDCGTEAGTYDIPSRMMPIPVEVEKDSASSAQDPVDSELINEPVYSKDGLLIGTKWTPRTSPQLKKAPYSLAALKKQQMKQAQGVKESDTEGLFENTGQEVNHKEETESASEQKEVVQTDVQMVSVTSSAATSSNVPNLDGHADSMPLSPASSLSSDRSVRIPPGLMFTDKIAHIVKEIQRRGSLSDDNTDHMTSDDDASYVLPQLDGVDDRLDAKVTSKVKGQEAEMALHDKIAQKIKAESLARSSTGEAGPFKCPSCKRLYRTKESCEKHAVGCDFVVSSDEEEGEDGDAAEDNRRKSYPLRHSRRLATPKDVREKPPPERLVTNKVKVVIDKLVLNSDISTTPVKRGRGRPPKNPVVGHVTPVQPTVVLKSASDPLKRGRGRPPLTRGRESSPVRSQTSPPPQTRSVASPQSHSKSVAAPQSHSKGVVNFQPHAKGIVNPPPTTRGRGRPPKVRVASPDNQRPVGRTSARTGSAESPIVLSPGNTPVKRPPTSPEVNSQPSAVLKSPSKIGMQLNEADRRSLRSARVVLSPVQSTNFTKVASNSVVTSNLTSNQTAVKEHVTEKGDDQEVSSTSEVEKPCESQEGAVPEVSEPSESTYMMNEIVSNDTEPDQTQNEVLMESVDDQANDVHMKDDEQVVYNSDDAVLLSGAQVLETEAPSSELISREITAPDSEIEGTHAGQFEGTHAGQIESTHAGQFEGTHAGQIESTHAGQIEGTHVGQTEFSTYGLREGVPVGLIEGTTDGLIEGTEDTAVGQLEGTPIGLIEGTTVGQLEGIPVSQMEGAPMEVARPETESGLLKADGTKPRVERVEIVTTGHDGSKKVICVSSENMCEELLRQGMPADMIPKLINTLKEKNLLKSDIRCPPLPRVAKPSSRVIRVVQNSPKNSKSKSSVAKTNFQPKTPERRIEPHNLQVLTTPPNPVHASQLNASQPTIITSPTSLLQSPVNILNQGGILQNGQSPVIQTMNQYSLLQNGQQIVQTALTSPVGIQTVQGLSGSPVQIPPSVSMVPVGMATQAQMSMGMSSVMSSVISQQPQVVSYSNYNLGGSLLQQQVPTVQQSIVGTGRPLAPQPTIVGPAQPVQDISGRVQGYVIRTTRAATSINSMLGNSNRSILNTSPVISLANSISPTSYANLPSSRNMIHGIPVDYVSSGGQPERRVQQQKPAEKSPVKEQVPTVSTESKPPILKTVSSQMLKSILRSQENVRVASGLDIARQNSIGQANGETQVINLTDMNSSVTTQNGITKAVAKLRESKKVPTVRLTKSKAAEVMIKKKYFSLDRAATVPSSVRNSSKRVIKVKQYLDHVETYDSDSQESTESDSFLESKKAKLTSLSDLADKSSRTLTAMELANLPMARVSLTDIIKDRKENSEREPRLLARKPRKEYQRRVREDDTRTTHQKDVEPFAPENEEDSLAHPMLHGTSKSSLPLPLAETEMEVADTPYFNLDDKENQPTNIGDTTPGKPHLKFEITSDDGLHVSAYSWQEAWQTVIDKVQDARANAHLKQLSFTNLDSLALFGLNHPAVVYLIEQLYGAHNCTNYRFKYHRYEQDMEETVENPSGAARCEAFSTRKPRDMFSFLLSQHRQGPAEELSTAKPETEMTLKSQRRATSMDLPMAMRFRHLRLHAKEAVGVYRSPIQGRGLFCKRDIDAGEMIIEYAGEVIRTALTDKREKYYDSRGIGSYMFRIDEYDCVDATMHGNAARFINHSCEPNCFSRVITVDNQKHIVIFALRPIKKGEELTYDYKFPIEDVKVPCYCGARRCRKFLN